MIKILFKVLLQNNLHNSIKVLIFRALQEMGLTIEWISLLVVLHEIEFY